MNPGSFFREVLESHEFQLSDTVIRRTAHVFEHIIFTPDNARLLDTERLGKEGRFQHYMVVISAAAR